ASTLLVHNVLVSRSRHLAAQGVRRYTSRFKPVIQTLLDVLPPVHRPALHLEEPLSGPIVSGDVPPRFFLDEAVNDIPSHASALEGRLHSLLDHPLRRRNVLVGDTTSDS